MCSVAPGVLLAAGWLLGGAAGPLLLGAAGLCAAAAGARVKFILVTRASFNQGFSLSQLPIRGVRPVR